MVYAAHPPIINSHPETKMEIEYFEEWELSITAGFTVKPPLEDSSEFQLPHDLNPTPCP